MKTLALLACLFMLGCASRTPLNAPNPTAVQGGISKVKTSATAAEEQRKQIEKLNQEARNKQSRIDNKDAFIEGYKKWKSKQQTP